MRSRSHRAWPSIWRRFVANRHRLWQLYKMSVEWREKPSSLLHLEDPYQAWCLDEATWMFGNHVEHLMNQAEQGQDKPAQKQAARQRALTAALKEPGTATTKAPPKGQFRDPAAMIK